MLDVTDATKQAYQNFGTSKELEIKIGNSITLTNSDIVAQSINLTERLETNENLTFTGCLSSVLKFKCKDISSNIKGAKIICSVTADNTEKIRLFTGIIDEVSNHSHEQATMDIVAYDELYTLSDVDMKSWYDNLSFPMTLKQFRDALFYQINIQQINVNLVNDGMTIYKTIDSENIACLDLMKWICQINGRYGRIDRYGKFDYLNLQEGLYPALNLYPSNSLYPGINNIPNVIDRSYYTSIDFENYDVRNIGRVNLRGKDDQIIAHAGNGNNIWTINTNPFIWGYEDTTPLSTVAENLYNEVKGISYTPLNALQLTGLPYIEVGDYISIQTKRSIIKVYLLERNLVGTQALKDSFSAKGIEKYPIYKPNIKQVADIVNNQMESVVEDIETISEDIGGINENIEEINNSVSDLSDIIDDKQDALTAGNGINITQNTISVTNPISYGTEDIGIGAELPTGHIYFVYEV